MKKTNATILLLAILILFIACGFYYTQRYAPEKFMVSFLKELEFKGAMLVDHKFLIPDLLAHPLVSWVDFYGEQKNKIGSNSLPKDELFKIWKSTFAGNISAYTEISLDYPDGLLMSQEEFQTAYSQFDFFNFEVKQKNYSQNAVSLSGYVDVSHKGSSLGNSYFSGKKKFDLQARNGKNGWKIIIFALQL